MDVRRWLLLDDSDEETLMIMESFLAPRHNIRDRSNPFEEYNESKFKERFRLGKAVVLELLQKFEEKLEFPNDRNFPLSPMLNLLVTLRFFATGSLKQVIGDLQGIHKSTACKTVKKVSSLIALESENYIKFPVDEQAISQIKQGFQETGGFPEVVGAIDCTHIPIQSPGGPDAESFRNKKGYFSVNVQAVCNDQMNITSLLAHLPGSVHDSTIWDSCTTKHYFESTRIQEVLLGDSGYPCKPYLLTPVLQPRNAAEQRYNAAHKSTRNTIATMFSMWKHRFPCLTLGLRIKLETTINTIKATAVLHNIALQKHDPVPPVNEKVQDQIDALTFDAEAFNRQNEEDFARRSAFIHQYFS